VTPAAHVEAERALLGAVLVTPSLLPGCALEHGDFTVEAHRAIWRAARRLDAAGGPVDAVAIRAELESRHEAAGVAELLSSLVAGSPRVDSTASWEAVIRAQARRRVVEAAGARMVAMARNGDEPADALDEGLRILTEAATTCGSAVDVDHAAHVNAAVAALEASATADAHAAAAGWSTGLPSLDLRLGRLQPGRLVIVAGRTGLGKSTLLANIGDAVAAQGGRVLLLSAEMTRDEVNIRRLVAQSGVPASHFEAGGVTPTHADWERLALAAGALGPRKFVTDACRPTPLQARAKARFAKARLGGLDVLLLDYLQLFPAGPGRKGETREAEVARVSRSAKALALDLGVCVVAACQLNRALEQRHDGRPRLSDLRESGSLEQDADAVILLHRPKPDDDVDAIVAKHRQRGPGVAQLVFNGRLHRFEEPPS